MAEYTKKYNPSRSSDWNYGGKKWKLSRSKIDLYLECPRCFYLDNKLGTKRPGMPSFNLNIAVDALFKKEFDQYRKSRTRHPIMVEYGIDAIPFAHDKLDEWRDAFNGITYTHPSTRLLVSGAVDDIWESPDGKLIVVDYKATSKSERIIELSDSSWEEQYRRQISVYQWLLMQNGFAVSSTAYFVYANGKTDVETFSNTLEFDTTLISCECETSWIEPTLSEIHRCLEGSTIPASGERCEYCPYREACGKKLQAMHRATENNS